MSYSALDAYASVITVDSSVVSGVIQRPIINVGSILGPVSTTFTGSPSISGAVTIVGTPSISGAVTVVGTPSISGTVDIGIIPGSVVAFQGGAWTPSVSGTVGASIIGNVNTTITSIATAGGSIPVTFSATANQSVSGTVGASVIGLPPVNLFMGGTIVSTSNPVPVQPPASGSLPVTIVGSVISLNIGSIITVNQGSSIIAVSTGSVISVPSGSVITVLQAPSIVGTYAEDAAHATGDKGLFMLNVRNDTMSSVTSADGEYSGSAVGPIGETIVSNAPLNKRVSGVADLRVVLGASVTAIAAQGASIFTYISGVQVVNFGPSSVIVTLGGGLGSILGYTIAPAGGGSNIVYPNYLKTGENSAFTASISGTASVLLSAQGFIAKI